MGLNIIPTKEETDVFADIIFDLLNIECYFKIGFLIEDLKVYFKNISKEMIKEKNITFNDFLSNIDMYLLSTHVCAYVR